MIIRKLFNLRAWEATVLTNQLVMGRLSKNAIKRTEMSAQGDNATVSQPPYYFRHSTIELSKKSRDDSVTSKQKADGEPSIIIASSSKGRCKYCTYWLTGMLIILLCIIISKLLFPYPLHASCIIKWKFDDPCTYVMQKFRCQIMNWSSWNVCRPRGDSCLYTLNVPAEENVIRATHRTSNSKSLEKINLIFEETNNTCLITYYIKPSTNRAMSATIMYWTTENFGEVFKSKGGGNVQV
ncbi:uncharacterized protein LOC114937806 isoform X3 [Nylanderia fulva]|uniref:uncharacterized protein LOC114937806 isoform X3 n=1 Tax=Nylanderia fulva TaxID=613905 RepID=UPI0010FB9A4E|nr:uncharacterized protein LOC114937806 isoform X3 [Nylanderia fulva]